MNAQVFWVELLGKSGDVLSRQRFEAADITIGRGYGNHVVVDDPYVAAMHLRIARDGNGTLCIEDLQTESGSIDATRRQRFSRLTLTEEAAVVIGQTSLRIRTAAFPVTAALAAPVMASCASGPVATAALPELKSPRRYAHLAWLLMAAVMAWSALSVWLSQTGEAKLSLYLPGMIVVPVLVLGWTGLWALINRIVTGQANFFRHMTIALTVLLLSEGIEVLGDFLDYALAWTAIRKALPLLLWVWLGIVCIVHLRVIVARTTRLAVGLAVGLTGAAMLTHLSLRAESERWLPPQSSTTLMPPFLLLKSPVPPDAFFHSTQALKLELDDARKKEPPEGGMFMEGFD